MKCEVCGSENKENALFCAQCGKALKDTPIDLDLLQINVPAAARKAHIVKVNAKKPAAPQKASAAVQKENQSQETPAETPAAAEQEENPAQESPAETPLIDLSTGKAVIAEEIPAPEAAPPAEKAAAPLRIIDWIVVLILTAIPVVDVVMLLIWAISSKTNPNKKSFAQAMLIFAAVVLVLGVAAFFVYTKFISKDLVTSWNQFI